MQLIIGPPLIESVNHWDSKYYSHVGVDQGETMSLCYGMFGLRESEGE